MVASEGSLARGGPSVHAMNPTSPPPVRGASTKQEAPQLGEEPGVVKATRSRSRPCAKAEPLSLRSRPGPPGAGPPPPPPHPRLLLPCRKQMFPGSAERCRA